MDKKTSPARLTGPAFTLEEHTLIEAWSARMRPRGLRTEIWWGHEFLEEALHVLPRWSSEIRWLVFHTSGGMVGLTLCPGIADIVPSVAAALQSITAQVDSEDGV